MEIKLPQDKLSRIQETLAQLEQKEDYGVLSGSLVGLLQHAKKVFRCGYTFTTRIYATAVKVRNYVHYYTRLNK